MICDICGRFFNITTDSNICHKCKIKITKPTEPDSSGCSVEPMVISQKERTTLWYLYDKKRGHFVYHHLDEGWDDAGRPKCHTEGNRWAKEIAWKDKSEIAAFKVSYSEI